MSAILKPEQVGKLIASSFIGGGYSVVGGHRKAPIEEPLKIKKVKEWLNRNKYSTIGGGLSSQASSYATVNTNYSTDTTKYYID